jgi:putative cofactor-binding repeat protein
LVKGRSVTGFANSEEAAIGLTHVVPFLVEDMLKENGGIYSKAADWQLHVVVDGNLITGQNPGSAQDGGRAVLQRLAADAAPSKEHQQSTAAVADGVAHHRA